MTDKEQIMIDGVDVSGCRNFDKESYKLDVYDCDLNELHGYCYCNNDCYFKQLARKTQECEGKERIIENQRKEIRKHRCKLKELKNKLKTLDEETTTVEITEAEFAEYQSYKKQHQELIEVNNKRKEEIKTLKYMLYEERGLCNEIYKANFKIAKLERTINSNKSRFTYELNRYRNALEDIKELISDDAFIRCPIYDDENCNYGTSRKILDIINKAKGEVNGASN